MEQQELVRVNCETSTFKMSCNIFYLTFSLKNYGYKAYSIPTIFEKQNLKQSNEKLFTDIFSNPFLFSFSAI